MKMQIISSPRTGSSYLYELLRVYFNDHIALIEPFNMVEHGIEISNKKFHAVKNARIICDASNIIMKNHVMHMMFLSVNYNKIFDIVMNQLDYTILIYRRNVLETTLSKTLTTMTGQWHEYNYGIPVALDQKVFDKCFDEVVMNLYVVFENKLNIKYNQIICYEDLTGIPKVDYSMLDLCHYRIGSVPDYNAHINTIKAPDKQDSIVNYDYWKARCAEKLSQVKHSGMKFNNIGLSSARYSNVL